MRYKEGDCSGNIFLFSRERLYRHVEVVVVVAGDKGHAHITSCLVPP